MVHEYDPLGEVFETVLAEKNALADILAHVRAVLDGPDDVNADALREALSLGREKVE